MPRAKCPDPALLRAYVDGTLFSRDVGAVEEHIASCERCAAILHAMRKQDAVAASTWPRPLVAAAALAAIAVTGIAVWTMRSGSNDVAPSEPPVVTQPEPPEVVTPPPVAPTPSPEKPVELAPAPAPKPAPVPKPAAAPKATTSPADATPPAEVAGVEDGVIVRGRRSNRRVIWRARDVVIEHSTDGGMTWATEHTTDRPVRSGVFVSADVAWLVGDSGLVLRRTKNGWFGTTPPADGNIKSIRASSASKATVTFEDGRAFATENGGVTWSSQ